MPDPPTFRPFQLKECEACILHITREPTVGYEAIVQDIPIPLDCGLTISPIMSTNGA